MKTEDNNMEMCNENIFTKIRTAIFKFFHKNRNSKEDYQDSDSGETESTKTAIVNKEEIESLDKADYNFEDESKTISGVNADDNDENKEVKNTYKKEFFEKYNKVKNRTEDIDNLSLREQLQIRKMLEEEVSIKEKREDEKILDKQIEQLRTENEKLEKELKKLEAKS